MKISVESGRWKPSCLICACPLHEGRNDIAMFKNLIPPLPIPSPLSGIPQVSGVLPHRPSIPFHLRTCRLNLSSFVPNNSRPDALWRPRVNSVSHNPASHLRVTSPAYGVNFTACLVKMKSPSAGLISLNKRGEVWRALDG